MDDFVIYEKENTRVYIQKLEKKKGHKLDWYAIRRDDDTKQKFLLGIIRFDGGWRQYVTEFVPNTKWSSGCKQMICVFENKLNTELREEWSKKNSS